MKETHRVEVTFVFFGEATMRATTIRKQMFRAASVAALVVIAAGCAHKRPAQKTQAARARQAEVTDMQIVDAVRNSGVKAAIISQHSIFPYHFVRDGETLNDLGKRDLAVLAAHLRAHPGELNMPRGATNADRYADRKMRVMEALSAQGVNANQVHIVDTFASGGESAPSEDVVRELRNLRGPQTPTQSSATPAQVGSSGATGVQQ
jgi:hypothetical protein